MKNYTETHTFQGKLVFEKNQVLGDHRHQPLKKLAEERYRSNFVENWFSLGSMRFRVVFHADSESDISFEPNRSFLAKFRLRKVS